MKVVKGAVSQAWLLPYSFKLLTASDARSTRLYHELTSPVDQPNLELIPTDVLGPWNYSRATWSILDHRFLKYQSRITSFWFIAGNGLIIQTASNHLTGAFSIKPHTSHSSNVDFIECCEKDLRSLQERGLQLLSQGHRLNEVFWGEVFHLGKADKRIVAQMLASAKSHSLQVRTLRRLGWLLSRVKLSSSDSLRFARLFSSRSDTLRQVQFLRQSLVSAVYAYKGQNTPSALAHLPKVGAGLALWVEVFVTSQLMSQPLHFTLTHLKAGVEGVTVRSKTKKTKWPLKKREQSPFLGSQLFDINYIKREKVYTKLKYSRSPQYDIVSGGVAALLSAFIGFLISEKFGYELPDSGDFYIVFMYIVFLSFSTRPLLKLVGVFSRAEAFAFSQSRQKLLHFWRRVRWTPFTWKWGYQFWRRILILSLRTLKGLGSRIRSTHRAGFEFVMTCDRYFSDRWNSK